MKEYVSSEAIANSIRMVRTQFSGAFLILEGAKDARLFRSYIEPTLCRIVNAINRDNAIGALDRLEQEAFKGVLAIVDADFHVLEGNLPESKSLLFTDHHDIEVMLVNSRALDKVLTEFGSPEKIVSFQERFKKEVRSALIEAGEVIGYLRWLSLRQNLGLNFENLSYSRFQNQDTLVVDAAKLIKVVKDHSQKHGLDENRVSREIEGLRSNEHDALHICCGHDLSALLSVGLRKTLGSNSAADVRQEVIERSLRLSFEASLFRETELRKSICDWEQNNPPFRILREA